MRNFRQLLVYFLFVSLFTSQLWAQDFSPQVMAPLLVKDMNAFNGELQKARAIGVKAVSVDVWWGAVEKIGDNQFDWSYYDNLFATIKANGLKIMPIMSFHKCGGNVGDDITIPLPCWVWWKYAGKRLGGVTLTANDMKYRSERGNDYEGYIALWLDALIADEYVDFMNDFENHFANYAETISELNISGGPSGELRYPSYNEHDQWVFPQRGYLQCYSAVAKQDFRNFVLQKYGTLANLNQAWSVALTSEDDILPPTGATGPDFFFANQARYLSGQYGKDFIGWYNSALIAHGKRMIGYGHQAFNGAMDAIPIGIKIPGVHWQMTNTDQPRTAEICAGLINTDLARANDHGYSPLLAMVKESSARLHFTCLEMNNHQADSTSLAQDLVFWIAQGASKIDLHIGGENALPGGMDSRQFWDNIKNAILWGPYDALTILRIDNVVNPPASNYYQSLIASLQNTGKASPPGDTTTSSLMVQKLGTDYSSTATTFAIWSPDSANVKLSLNGTEHVCDKVKDFDGYTDIYGVRVPGDHKLREYSFNINGIAVRDPYGTMVKPGTNRNIVMDMASIQPVGGWLPIPPLAEREDAIIYEVHIRDFTWDGTSGVSPEKRGKFLGMVETGTTYNGVVSTGIDHLKELGVTHVQILPFYDFSSSQYNWGYDPVNYNIPEEQYSITPANYEERVRELQTMVNEFHRNGIRVIMDVVYNHTTSDEMFENISRKYYTGNNDSGTGNGINAGEPMVSRMIRDSLEFLVENYAIDGFRFDLLGVFPYRAVKQWGEYLNNQRFPDRNLLLYGEPWNGYFTDPMEVQKVRLGNAATLSTGHFGVFNSKFREAIKGDNDSSGRGYMFNATQNGNDIRMGSRGGIRYQKGTEPLPNLWDPMFAYDPEQSVNYISAHDNLCLWDKIKFSQEDNEYGKRIVRFGMGIVLTSQGIPLIHAGDEMLRSKVVDGDWDYAKNSYNAPDKYNVIRWNWKVENAELFHYFKDLIALRKAHAGFRLNTWDEINTLMTSSIDGNVVVSVINAEQNGDSWDTIVVVYNSGNTHRVHLPSGSWTKVFGINGAVNVPGLQGAAAAAGTAVTAFSR